MPIAEWVDLFGSYTDVQPLAWQADPRGDEYGEDWQPTGEPVRTCSRKLTSSEKFERGKQDTVLRYEMLVDLSADGNATVNEKGKIDHPEGGRLDVVSVVPYQTEGLAIVEAERVS